MFKGTRERRSFLERRSLLLKHDKIRCVSSKISEHKLAICLDIKKRVFSKKKNLSLNTSAGPIELQPVVKEIIYTAEEEKSGKELSMDDSETKNEEVKSQDPKVENSDAEQDVEKLVIETKAETESVKPDEVDHVLNASQMSGDPDYQKSVKGDAESVSSFFADQKNKFSHPENKSHEQKHRRDKNSASSQDGSQKSGRSSKEKASSQEPPVTSAVLMVAGVPEIAADVEENQSVGEISVASRGSTLRGDSQNEGGRETPDSLTSSKLRQSPTKQLVDVKKPKGSLYSSTTPSSSSRRSSIVSTRNRDNVQHSTPKLENHKTRDVDVESDDTGNVKRESNATKSSRSKGSETPLSSSKMSSHRSSEDEVDKELGNTADDEKSLTSEYRARRQESVVPFDVTADDSRKRFVYLPALPIELNGLAFLSKLQVTNHFFLFSIY